MTEPTDFFVAGGTLRATDPSYVTRPADHDLLQQLQAGEFCYVLTPRQMGKSSLMVRTAQRLREDGTLVAIVDLTSIGGGSSELSAYQWYLGLLSRVRAQLRLATDVEMWWDEHAALGIAQRFITFLHDVLLTECDEPVAILIDEIDSTLNLDFRDDFFAAIRALYNERATDPIYQRLTFALFGVATPTDLIQDRERTPFNIGQRIDLQEFTPEDAQPLRDGLAARFPAQADAILQCIFNWTNGHPYLTQKLCQVLQTAALPELENDVAGSVDEAVQDNFFSEEGRKDPNLTFVQDRIANSPDSEKRRMLQLYNRVHRRDDVTDDDRSPVQNRLELYGLVGMAQGQLRVRNEIYARVFDDAWIGAMMPVDRRQRQVMLAAVGALVLSLGIILWIIVPPSTECYVYKERFLYSDTSDIRLSTLADLIGQGCQAMAQDLFYHLGPEEQQVLFVSLKDKPSERNRLVLVIAALYRTLDTVPEHDTALIRDWYDTLKLSEVKEGNQLLTSIFFWDEGQNFSSLGRYKSASIEYENALGNVADGNHPALRYDLALAYIELEEYDKALDQLNEILRIAAAMPATLTSTASSTPYASSTQEAAATLTRDDNFLTLTPSVLPINPMTPIVYGRKFRDADTMRN
ncbi:MAG: AAA-like domain-containing protein, partial [Caldilineaceae bacterium]|nr:AAA-like domain-containing protein [Caldilineaceae bacterium]